MPPIDPRIVRAKRFPLHAAVDRCRMEEVKRLCEEDAEFHVVRKVQDLDLTVLHSACTFREIEDISEEIATYLIKNGAPINEPDSIGQTPLHYAVSNPRSSGILIPILLSAGADPNVKRKSDGWTPLHLAAMFGNHEVIKILLKSGADMEAEDKNGEKPDEIARKYRFYSLADMLHSPRKLHRPNPLAENDEDMDVIKLTSCTSREDLQKIRMREKFTTWKDKDENTLLHLASWNGNLELCKWFFEAPKGRKLCALKNLKGATPLALAIINGQIPVVEEYFMNKHSKSNIDLATALDDSGENIVHLLIQYLPDVHPKFVLKRKDLNKEVFNSPDHVKGNSPLLHCAERNNKFSIKRILSSKAVKDRQLLDLGMKNKSGKTLLHILIENKDEDNFRLILENCQSSLTPEITNALDEDGNTCLITCLLRGSPYTARDILQHPVAKDKFILDYNREGLSPLHLVAEQGNYSLWSIAVLRPDCNLNSKDSKGNTPLMTAAIHSRTKMLESWFLSVGESQNVDLSSKNNEGDTLLSLFIKHVRDPKALNSFLSSVNMRSVVNELNAEMESPLLIATSRDDWETVRILLGHPNLRKKMEGSDDTEGVVDVHLTNTKTGLTPLTSVLTARVKLTRQAQTHTMKKQRVLAEECKKDCERLWDLLKVILAREKEMHGSSMVHGRDGGSACIRKQIEAGKLIRPPVPEEVISEYVKNYQFIKKKKVNTNGAIPSESLRLLPKKEISIKDSKPIEVDEKPKMEDNKVKTKKKKLIKEEKILIEIPKPTEDLKKEDSSSSSTVDNDSQPSIKETLLTNGKNSHSKEDEKSKVSNPVNVPVVETNGKDESEENLGNGIPLTTDPSHKNKSNLIIGKKTEKLEEAVKNGVNGTKHGKTIERSISLPESGDSYPQTHSQNKSKIPKKIHLSKESSMDSKINGLTPIDSEIVKPLNAPSEEDVLKSDKLTPKPTIENGSPTLIIPPRKKRSISDKIDVGVQTESLGFCKCVCTCGFK